MTELSITILAGTAADAQPIERLHERTFGPGRFALTAYRLREHVDHRLDLSFTARIGTLMVGSVRQLPICIGDAKALMLDVLSKGFREHATRAGLRFNPAFAGAYNFSKKPDFATLFERFLHRLPDGGLVMCHPGFVDKALIDLDPLTDQRKHEYDWLMSDGFPKTLAAQNVTLA